MSQPPEPTHPAQLRASDADRERIAGLLREAAAEGRLDINEVDERLSQAYSARTYGDLEPLISDIPVAGAVRKPVASYDPSTPASGTAIAIMGGFSRKGQWRAQRQFNCLAFWGGGEIDLRQAQLTDGVLTIRAFAIMGGIEIIAPEDATVHVTGVGIMGGFEHDASNTGAPGAPTIVVQGLAFWGGVSVKRRPTIEEVRQRKLERKRLKEQRRLEGR